MFDTNNVTHKYSPSHVTTNVHEHRAPTDESVKLLNDMQEKAKANLIYTFSTSNNLLQATWAEYVDQITDTYKFFCKYTLNNKDYYTEINLNNWQLESVEHKVDLLYAKLCQKLTQELMQPLLEEMRRKSYVP